MQTSGVRIQRPTVTPRVGGRVPLQSSRHLGRSRKARDRARRAAASEKPHLNAYAKRFVRSIRQECLRHIVVPLGERHLRRPSPSSSSTTTPNAITKGSVTSSRSHRASTDQRRTYRLTTTSRRIAELTNEAQSDIAVRALEHYGFPSGDRLRLRRSAARWSTRSDPPPPAGRWHALRSTPPRTVSHRCAKIGSEHWPHNSGPNKCHNSDVDTRRGNLARMLVTTFASSVSPNASCSGVTSVAPRQT